MPHEKQAVAIGDRALTFREAREKYGVPEHRLRQCRAEKVLDFFKIGKAVYVSEQSLIAFLEKHRQAATASDGGK